MRKHFKARSFLLAFLLPMGVIQPMCGQDVQQSAEHEKKERAEIQRLAGSSRMEDRLSAVQQLAWAHMDYALLWQLMNDADKGVRLMAIGAMTSPSCTALADKPLSAELAQKMAAMLEKEVTPERIAAAFAPGPVKNDETGLITTAAETLNHLFLYEPLQQSPAAYAGWQRRVPRQIFLAASAADGKGPFSEQLYACRVSALRLLTEPALLSSTLPQLMQKLDSPDTPPQVLLETLRLLWSHHDLLSDGRPCHLLLLAQVAPRLDSLRTRILAPMKDGQDKEQAALLLGYYQEAIETARKKLPTPSHPPPKTAPTPAQTPATPATAEAAETLNTPPALPPLSPQEQQQRRTQLQRLTASSKAQDRISAADEMVTEGIEPDLYQKLLHDPDPTVSESAMDALLYTCEETPCLIPLEEARKIAALLEPEVTEERITTLYEGESTQQHRIHMACHAALALSRLYRQRALLPSPSAYGYWQERVLRSLVIRIAGDYRNPAGENDEPVLRIFLAITDPATLQQTAELLDTYPNLDDIPAARQLFYLTELWAHPLLGEGSPMNPVLLQQLAPVWQPVRDHILRNVGDKDRPDQDAAALLARIDAAFARVRLLLSTQPAVR